MFLCLTKSLFGLLVNIFILRRENKSIFFFKKKKKRKRKRKKALLSYKSRLLVLLTVLEIESENFETISVLP
jgi:hypothetical protein